MQIDADIHERRGGVPDELRRLGIHVIERKLFAGDYAAGGACLIERKTTNDLHGSVLEGRFWQQIGKLRRASAWPYLLIEGETLFGAGLVDEGARGVVLSVTDLGVTVIRSLDPRDSAQWIRRIGLRRRQGQPARDRPPYAQRPKRSPEAAPAEVALSAAAGVSTVTARALLLRFGSLLEVLLASPGQLESVDGVGRRRAIAIVELARATSHFGDEPKWPRAT